MKNLGENEFENKGTSSAAHLHKNPFSIPDGYFDSLHKDILFHTKIISLSESSFTTPRGYHSELTNAIFAKLHEENIRKSIKHDGFEVPPRYFEELRSELEDQLLTDKIVPLYKKKRTSWINYGVAASVALLVSLTVLLTTITTKETHSPDTVSVDVIPTQEIINYLSFYSETGDLAILSDQLDESNSVNFPEIFSTDEIEAYLENSI